MNEHINFWNHLDVCSHCERHPFDLCSTGARLLEAAAINLPRPQPPLRLNPAQDDPGDSCG